MNGDVVFEATLFDHIRPIFRRIFHLCVLITLSVVMRRSSIEQMIRATLSRFPRK